MRKSDKTTVLVVLDGWGISPANDHNAITCARTPCWDHLLAHYPNTALTSSGEKVGLPDGQMGNSEVGHLHIGLGRLIQQDLSRINNAISSGDFFENPVLTSMFDDLKRQEKTLHILGLLSPGGVHSHEDHIHALLTLAARKKCHRVIIHAFLDGRDCPPQSAAQSLEKLMSLCDTLGVGEIGSLSGRYYAMDRDNRWDRIERAYNILVQPEIAPTADSALEALQAAYTRGETDEFVIPIRLQTHLSPVISDGDTVCFMNFRSDRARELTHAFLDPVFDHFKRTMRPGLSQFVSLTQYDVNLETEIAFPATTLTNGLGEYLANLGYHQLRLAETEKYAHVTFFFNGGQEAPFANEDRCLIPSLKIATYDLRPEMSAPAITDKLTQALHSYAYDVIICNFANADMVGHTGNFEAACQAVEVLDHCLQQLLDALIETKSDAFITADHGNAECMVDNMTHQPHTAHTNFQVPLVYISPNQHAVFIDTPGTLADIAPTLLSSRGLTPPPEMTGGNLLSKK